ncbi:MAG: acyl carrier protein [Bacteroidales bacterium]|nr:acyl carrier protein [Candidatus Cacconaster equifaecalis]MCQ2152518.1 acyl carrier protein [Bacteroidales bacterium]MCQ2158100.1 acyl carrier protein [Bacteroidales bacterium]
MDIKKELLDIVCEYVDLPAEKINTSEGLQFAGLDSFALLSMVSSIESKFGITIPNESLRTLKTLDDFIVLIQDSVK